MKLIKFICLLSLITIYSCSEKVSREWEANWIGPETDNPNSWICYRKTITLKGENKTAVAKIACDSKYWLWINGRMAVFEGQLKRGPTPEDTYYDSVDIKPFLKKGDNTLAILVWYFGKHGFSHNNSGKAGLIFDSEIDGKRFLSDSTWKVKLHPAYGNTGEPHPNYRLPEGNTHFNAMNDIPGWMNPEFDDSGWQNATEMGIPPVKPWNNLVLRPILQWKNSGLVSYNELTTITTDQNERLYAGK